MESQKKFVRVLFLVSLILSFFLLSQGQTKRIRSISEHLLFKCKGLIDPVSGKVHKNTFIEVNNGKILRTGESGSLKSKKEVKVFNFSDKYIIPGLIDTHGHLFGGVMVRHTTCDMIPAFYLAAGVTTVRSPGSMEPEGDMGLRFRIDSGRFLGPRYFLSGPYVEMDPVTVGRMNPVRTPEEVRLKIEHWVRQGATSVKVYASMKDEVLKAAIEHGHAHGVKVLAHLGSTSYQEAIEMGIDEIFHGVMAFPEIQPKDIGKKDPKERYAWYSDLNLETPEVREILRQAARAKVILTPTSVVVEPIETGKNHLEEQKKFYTEEAWAKIEERLKNPSIPNSEKILEKNKQFIKMAQEADCILTTGTDQVGFTLLPGYSLWREMEIFAEAGLKPREVLKAATINGATAIGRSDLLGSLEPGKLADFVILDDNPLQNISNIRKIHRVVKGGILYEPETLLKPLIGKFH